MKLKSEIGNKYTNLTVINFAGMNKQGRAAWHCQCICGKTTIVPGTHLRTGNTKSCGCQPGRGVRHGLNAHPIYTSYYEAHTRCTNNKRPEWKNYGGRGIQFKLGTFKEFAAAMLDTWFKGAWLDRTDNNGHYEYGNIKWTTPKEQGKNRRDNVWYEYDGKTLIMADWARELGIGARALQLEVRKWGVAEAIERIKKRRGL